MTDLEKNIRLGIIGERLVGNRFTEEGCKVIYPVNPFDDGKDLLVDEKKVEVKTLVPMVKGNYFQLHENQLYKLQTCDRVIFVSVPFPSGTKHSSCGNIYEVVPKGGRHDQNLHILIFDISALKLLWTITDDNELAYLKRYSTSNY
jgi:hypothetical protein